MKGKARALIVAAALIVSVAALIAAIAELPKAGDETMRLIAVPVSTPEPAVLQALAAAGVEDALCASTTVIPLSDFSRIVSVAYSDASVRVAASDPRRTPLFDELDTAFYVNGPDGERWRTLYVSAPSPATDAAIAKALSGLGSPWAWDAESGYAPNAILWLPAAVLSLWLAVRKPKRYRLLRILLIAACFPLLARSTMEAALILVALQAMVAIATPLFIAAETMRIPAILWPLGLVVLALSVLDPGCIPFVAVSVALIAGAVLGRPRLELLAHRRYAHEPPRFRRLIKPNAGAEARAVLSGAAVAACLVVVLSLIAPSGSPRHDSSATEFSVERELARDAALGPRLLETHLAFQKALTFGRIGDARWGSPSFSEIYRYTEKDGQIRRSESDSLLVAGDEGLSPDTEAASYNNAATVLAERRPRRIRRS